MDRFDRLDAAAEAEAASLLLSTGRTEMAALVMAGLPERIRAALARAHLQRRAESALTASQAAQRAMHQARSSRHRALWAVHGPARPYPLASHSPPSHVSPRLSASALPAWVSSGWPMCCALG